VDGVSEVFGGERIEVIWSMRWRVLDDICGGGGVTGVEVGVKARVYQNLYLMTELLDEGPFGGGVL